jgi:hypothetical protein
MNNSIFLFYAPHKKAKKNSSGVPYNTVTLQYHDGLDGNRLRHNDDLVRYRGALRAKNLLECGDTRVSYDILNGANLPPHVPPARPQVPHLDLQNTNIGH